MSANEPSGPAPGDLAPGTEAGAKAVDQTSPPWDGLSDEHGPIPTFGPARTDQHGRIVMTDEEWEARSAAAIRALRAIEEITDETDTDEIWDEVFRGLKEGR
jgi:hypothetical protein